MLYAGALFTSAVLSFVLTPLVLRYLKSRAVLDRPNDRSSHTIPTPRGGGLVVVAVVTLIGCTTVAIAALESIWVAVLLLALPIAMVGWLDDLKGLPMKTRLAVQVLIAVAALACIHNLVPESSFRMNGTGIGPFAHSRGIGVGWSIPFGGVAMIVSLLWIVWSTNSYNFMDGIDGILATQVATVGVGFFALTIQSREPESALLFLILAGAAVGFLKWNWHRASIFMGDVGSTYLGFLVATLAVVAASLELLDAANVFVLSAAFIGDTTWTLIRRTARTRRPPTAHRSHAYQKLTQSGYSHARVSLLYGAFNVFWLMPVAYLLESKTLPSLVALSLAYAPVFAFCWIVEAGVDSVKQA